MTGRTHRQGGMLCAMVGFIILRDNGLLFGNINPLLQLLIIYPFARWGSIASDLDHHWGSCPDKSIPSWVINHVLHLAKPLEDNLKRKGSVKSPVLKLVCTVFNAKHRSWQTHSDLTLVCMLLLLSHIMQGKLGSWVLSSSDIVIASLIMTGVVIGIIAHFIYDILTPEGIKLVGVMIINSVFHTKLKDTVSLVPKSKFFATSGSWETFIRNLSTVATWVLTVYIVVTTVDPNFVSNILNNWR